MYDYDEMVTAVREVRSTHFEILCTDALVRASVNRALAGAGCILEMATCPTEARMRLAIGLEGAMAAVGVLAEDQDLARDIEDVRRAAASAARLYGRQYAEELVSS